jgi:uracil-DNA glycosylase
VIERLESGGAVGLPELPGSDPAARPHELARGALALLARLGDADVFYDASRIAIIPMGYCYPGRGDGGDLPPRWECATLWLDQLLARLPGIELTLLVGQHAQRHFLGSRRELRARITALAGR